MPYDVEREQFVASFRVKQLVVLAAEFALADMRLDTGPPEDVASELITSGVLPACYQPRYDAEFLQTLQRVCGLTRNLLVSDSPYLPDTMSELAAHAIFRQAYATLGTNPEVWELEALAIDPQLPKHIRDARQHLAEELTLLRDVALQDTDVRVLFDVPGGETPEAYLGRSAIPDEAAPLRFENWRAPFGCAPRPVVTYDGRAWSQVA